MKIQSYKELEVWKTGIEIVSCVYKATKNFPSDERFGLVSQMQRAAVSIPTNIAEGYNRQYTKEYVQFCSIALGSCSELETLAIISLEQEYLSQEGFKKLNDMLQVEGKMLRSLVARLKSL